MALRRLSQALRTSLLIFVLALGIRLVWIALNSHEMISDELDYHRLAVSLVEDGAYAIGGMPTAYRPPGYPLILWLVYSIAGVDANAVLILQAVLDALLAVLLFRTLLARDTLAARIAGYTWAMFPTAILFSGLLLTETLFTGIVFGALLLVATREDAPSVAASGLLLGLGCLIKPWLVVFVGLLGIYAVLQWGSRRQLLIAVVVAGLCTIPWMMRNSSALGVFTLSTNAGMNLYVGNNPDATGGYSGRFPEQIVSAIGNERRLDSLSRSLALDDIAGHPGRFVVNAVKKAARLFGSEGELLVYSFSSDDHGTRYSTQYRDLPLAVTILANLPSLLLLVLGTAGLVTAEKTPERPYALLLAVALLLTTIVFFGSSRFRFPMTPYLVLYGSLVAAHPKSYLQSLSPLKRAVAASVVLFICALWITEAVLLANA